MENFDQETDLGWCDSTNPEISKAEYDDYCEMVRARRVQRKRSKGFKLPPNTKCVDRTTKWGNPYKVSKEKSKWVVLDGRIDTTGSRKGHMSKWEALKESVELYEKWVKKEIESGNLDLSELKGKNLACFCPLDSPCHADVLFKLIYDLPF